MALAQINAATCAVVITLCLWVWTRLKLPEGCQSQETPLRRQNTYAYWSFAALVGFEILADTVPLQVLRLGIGPLSGLIFYFFAVFCYQSEAGFWSKRRNQFLGLTLSLLLSFGASFFLTEASFVPLFSAFAISHLCHRKYMQIVFACVKDIETLQAKLLKQEAAYSNMRHFNVMTLRQTSQQA